MSIILAAASIAQKYHGNHKRKYNDLPYFTHLARVAGTVAAYPDGSEEMVAAAFLHDIVEDEKITGVTKSILVRELAKECNEYEEIEYIADLVMEVTNPSIHHKHLSRSARKQMDNEHLAKASTEGMIIKLADRLDNIRDIADAEHGWQKKYCGETLITLSYLKERNLFTNEPQDILTHQIYEEVYKLCPIFHQETDLNSIRTLIYS